MTKTTENNPGRTRIQQLLAAIGSNTREDDKQVEAVDYDWHQPHFFNSQETKKLAGFTTKAAALIAGKFGALCQSSFEVTITSTSEHFAGQFLGQDPAGKTQGPGNYYLPFRTEQEDPCGFISIPPQTAIIWTTQLLGDTDSTKPLSGLEASFFFDMASLIVEAITGAGEKCSFHPAADAMTDHLPLQLKGTEEFCKITFQVKKTGSETGSEAHILVLCEKLAPAIGETAQTGKFSAKDIARAIQNHIEKIPVPITVQLACVPVTVEQIMSLTVGDVLLLDKKIDEPVQLIAAGRTVCRGLCAKSAGKYALAVTEAVFETT
jgi:flagellar motor switch/type III secretory pathway protein FliN